MGTDGNRKEEERKEVGFGKDKEKTLEWRKKTEWIFLRSRVLENLLLETCSKAEEQGRNKTILLHSWLLHPLSVFKCISHYSSSILERKDGKKLSFFSSPAVCHKVSDRQIKGRRKQMDGWMEKEAGSKRQAIPMKSRQLVAEKETISLLSLTSRASFPLLPFFRKLTPTLGSELLSLSLSNCSWHDFKKSTTIRQKS